MWILLWALKPWIFEQIFRQNCKTTWFVKNKFTWNVTVNKAISCGFYFSPLLLCFISIPTPLLLLHFPRISNLIPCIPTPLFLPWFSAFPIYPPWFFTHPPLFPAFSPWFPEFPPHFPHSPFPLRYPIPHSGFHRWLQK